MARRCIFLWGSPVERLDDAFSRGEVLLSGSTMHFLVGKPCRATRRCIFSWESSVEQPDDTFSHVEALPSMVFILNEKGYICF